MTETITLVLTPQEVQTIANALLEIPTKFGMPVLTKLQAQLTAKNESEKEVTVETEN